MDKLNFEIRKFLYKNRKNLNSMILGGCFCIILIIALTVYFLVFKPLKSEYNTLANTNYVYSANISRMEELSTCGEQMTKKINEINTIYDNINDIIPDKSNIPYVTSQISLAARNSNVTIGEMVKENETSIKIGKDDFGVVTYYLSCYGTYGNTTSFLSTLETCKSIFAIGKVTISPLDEEELKKYDDFSFVNSELIINIYMKAKK